MKYPKYPKIKIYLKSNFEKNILKVLNYSGMEYSPFSCEKNVHISEMGSIIHLDKASGGYGLYANFKEISFFDLFTSKNKAEDNKFVIFISRLFQSPFKVIADYDVPNDLVFDTERYLELFFGMCKDVLISDIIIMGNEETYYDIQTFKNPVRNSLAAIIGDTYSFTSGIYFIAKLLNNILDEEETTIIYTDIKTLEPLKPFFDYTDNARWDFYYSLAEALNKTGKVDVLVRCRGYFIAITIQPNEILMVPYLPHKVKKTEDAEGTDIPFYAELLTKMCRGIAISDFETFFNRSDDVYIAWPPSKQYSFLPPKDL